MNHYLSPRGAVHRYYLLSLLVLLALPAPWSAALAQQRGDRIAAPYKAGTVRITARFTGGGTEEGFGFLVGERNGDLFLVTANHLIERGPDGRASSIEVRFSAAPDEPYQARWLKSKGHLDLALLKIDNPDIAVQWRQAAWCTAFQPGEKAGAVFRDPLEDGGEGPPMVAVPKGCFRMGDIQGGGGSDEQPVHEVCLDAFAIGVHEVTFEAYDRFAAATGRSKPEDQGWGRGERPVIDVSWNDALAYAEWLSAQTGHAYGLPTEAQWEYAARAGSETRYWWGNEIGRNRAACDGCGAKWGWDADRKTAPVASFAANPFGLHDTAGNVWEWTCSEYAARYDGSEQRCASNKRATSPVPRGGSWNNTLGFRVVRLASLPAGRQAPDPESPCLRTRGAWLRVSMSGRPCLPRRGARNSLVRDDGRRGW